MSCIQAGRTFKSMKKVDKVLCVFGAVTTGDGKVCLGVINCYVGHYIVIEAFIDTPEITLLFPYENARLNETFIELSCARASSVYVLIDVQFRSPSASSAKLI